MFAWARRSQSSPFALDIDLIDPKGNVCVEMRGLSFHADSAAPAVQAQWQFIAGGDTAAYASSMGAAEKIELFLRQETALQLQIPVEQVPIDRSYFDLGMTSLGITHLIQKTNQLLDESLSPGVLFEYRDIQSLAAYLASTYPARLDALAAVRQKESPVQQQVPAAKLKPLPRKAPVAVRPTAPPQEQAAAEISEEQILEKVLWLEKSLDDRYEKVTF
jgi:acyl carrier protein